MRSVRELNDYLLEQHKVLQSLLTELRVRAVSSETMLAVFAVASCGALQHTTLVAAATALQDRAGCETETRGSRSLGTAAQLR